MGKKKEKQNHSKKNSKASKNSNYSELDENSSGNKLLSLRRLKRNNKSASRKRDNGSPSSSCLSSDDVTFRKALERDGTRAVVDMASDGNCLFRSLSDQLYADYGNHHDQVRADVCDFMEQHQDEFSGFLVLDETESDHDAQDFESYISAMREEGEWGGNLELVAAARCYRRNITVFSAPLAALTIECGEDNSKKTTGPDLQLSYHDNDHYNSVRPTNGSIKPSKPIPRTSPPPPLLRQQQQREPRTDSSIQTKSTVSQSEEEGEAVEVELQEPDEEYNHDDGLSFVPSDDRDPYSTITNDTTSVATTEEEDKEDDNHTNYLRDQLSNENKLKNRRMDIMKKKGSCPCGSGLRYKKCCLAKEKHAARLKKMNGDKSKNTVSDEESLAHDSKDEEHVLMNGNFRVLKI